MRRVPHADESMLVRGERPVALQVVTEIQAEITQRSAVVEREIQYLKTVVLRSWQRRRDD